MVTRIDLNADLGEGFGIWRLGDDDALLGVVSSANVACGFHAGDPSTMRRVCAGAVAARRDDRRPGVLPRPDRVRPAVHRRRPRRAADDVLYQLAALDGIARIAGGRVGYVKPHGALYNATVGHEGQALAVVARSPPTTRRAAGARPAGLGAAARGGGRRACAPWPRASPTAATRRQGTLVSRDRPGALVHDPAVGAERRAHGRATASWSRSTAARSLSRSTRCACTATPRRGRARPLGAGGAREGRRRVEALRALSFPRVLPLGDAAVTLELGDSLDEATNERVRAVDADLARAPFDGFRESVPPSARCWCCTSRGCRSRSSPATCWGASGGACCSPRPRACTRYRPSTAARMGPTSVPSRAVSA